MVPVLLRLSIVGAMASSSAFLSVLLAVPVVVLIILDLFVLFAYVYILITSLVWWSVIASVVGFLICLVVVSVLSGISLSVFFSASIRDFIVSGTVSVTSFIISIISLGISVLPVIISSGLVESCSRLSSRHNILNGVCDLLLWSSRIEPRLGLIFLTGFSCQFDFNSLPFDFLGLIVVIDFNDHEINEPDDHGEVRHFAVQDLSNPQSIEEVVERRVQKNVLVPLSSKETIPQDKQLPGSVPDIGMISIDLKRLF